MPFDKTFVMRPSILSLNSSTNYNPSIDLAGYGTYPNGIIIQVLKFEGYYSANATLPYIQLRFPQITNSPNPGAGSGGTVTYKVTASETINMQDIFPPQFYYKLTEIEDPVKINGFNNATLNMSILTSSDGVISSNCEFLIKIRIIGF